MKKRTTMLMSALFAAGAFALNGNVAKADNVQAVNNNNANSTEVKQNTVNADSSKVNVASAQASNQADTKIPSKEQLKDTAMKQYNEYVNTPLNARKDYDVAVWGDTYGVPIFVDNAVLGGNNEDPNAILIHQSQLKTYDWTPVNNEINAAKESLTSYLNKAVEKDNTSLESSRKEASDNLKKINLPKNGELAASDEWHAVEDDPTVQKNRNNTEALGTIWDTMQNPYLAKLIGSRTAIENSDYKNEAGFYSDKLAELVAKNIKKDKNWVLANTNPKTITLGIPGDNPEGWEGIETGEGAPVEHITKRDTVLPYFIYNKELIKVDRDAYNRNHGIKSDENVSDNKNQSTTDTKKDQASQNVTDNATSKKDQSSEKVTNDTTSKKDQSTTSTSSSNTNQTTESKSSTISSKTTSDTKTPVAKNEGSNTKTTDVVKSKNKATENTASVVKNDTKAATEKTTDVKVVALNSKVNAGTASTTPAAAAKGSQSKATENKLPQAGTDEKISLFASLAGLSIASLGLGALGASKKRKND